MGRRRGREEDIEEGGRGQRTVEEKEGGDKGEGGDKREEGKKGRERVDSDGGQGWIERERGHYVLTPIHNSSHSSTGPLDNPP